MMLNKKALRAAKRAVTLKIQFGDFGHYEDDPHQPGEKQFVSNAAQIEDLDAKCEEAAQAAIEAFIAALPGEDEGLVKTLRDEAAIADSRRHGGMAVLLGKAADALEVARAMLGIPEGWQPVPKKELELLVSALEHSLRFSRLPKFQLVELEARLQYWRERLTATPEISDDR